MFARNSSRPRYIAGTIISIFVTVTNYNWKYRGLLIHAVNDAEETVGSWEYVPEYSRMFWTPGQCPGRVLHYNADLKPFKVELKFATPPTGTGTIAFRSLLKRGPAQTGAFHHANLAGDLVLRELELEADGPRWTLGRVDESCDAACDRYGDVQVGPGDGVTPPCVGFTNDCRSCNGDNTMCETCTNATYLEPNEGTCVSSCPVGTEAVGSGQFGRQCVGGRRWRHKRQLAAFRCDATAIATHALNHGAAAAFAESAGLVYPCPPAIVATCLRIAPAVNNATGSCMLRDSSCLAPINASTCTGRPEAAECGMSAAGFRRFCACQRTSAPDPSTETPTADTLPPATAPSPPAVTTHTVSWGNTGVGAASITIASGDTVRWLLDQQGGHNVVSGTPHGVPDGNFSSPMLLNVNDEWSQTFTVDTTTVFSYYCDPHPWMVATITVVVDDIGPGRLRARRDAPSATSAAASTGHGASSFVTSLAVLSATQLAVHFSTPQLVAATLVLSLGSLITPTTAHQWLRTRSRSQGESATASPCRPRKETDTHAQIGPGQDIVVEWSTGHGIRAGINYVVVVHGANYSWLRDPRLKEKVQDYIHRAPVSANTAADARYQRYHGVDNGDKLESFLEHKVETDRGNNHRSGFAAYGDRVPESDPNYHTHTSSYRSTDNLFRFNAEVLEEDYRISYASERYPWLEAAYRYPVETNRHGDIDSVRVTIPGRSGPGHYVVHWFWKGFSDCVDVNVHPDPVPEDEVYGINTGEYAWNKIDHCQFIKPLGILTPCRDASESAAECRDDLNAHTRQDAYGINVVPLTNPPEVMFPETVAVPFNDYTCANTEWTTLPAPGQAAARDFSSEDLLNTTFSGGVFARSCRRRKTSTRDGNYLIFRAGTRCDNYGGAACPEFSLRGSLSDAVRACSQDNCIGVAWDTGLVSASALDAGERAEFYLCSSWDDVAPEADPDCSTGILGPNDVCCAAECGRCGGSGCGALPGGGSSCCAGGSGVSRTRSCHDNPPPCVVGGGHMAFIKPEDRMAEQLDTPIPADMQFDVVVDFHPNITYTGTPVQLENDEILRDHGGVFGQRGGQMYGWTCELPQEGTHHFAAGIITRGRNGGAYTVNNTMLNQPESHRCDGGAAPEWEMEVPNAVYAVTTIHNLAGERGFRPQCFVENVPMSQIGSTSGRASRSFTQTVEVTDGRLTLYGLRLPNHKCNYLNRLRIERVSASPLRPVWYPVGSRSNNGAWWQRRLATSEPIGLVSISAEPMFGPLGDDYDCTFWFLFAGNKCNPGRLARNILNGDDKGLRVSISDEPCTAAGCLGGSLCGVHIRVPEPSNNHLQEHRMDVDCDGAAGRYIRVHLPGANRILPGVKNSPLRFPGVMMIEMNRATPLQQNVSTLACYGLRPRALTEVKPQFIISDDPYDPIFYSTCWQRTPRYDFLPPAGTVEIPPEPPRWAFHGSCLSCDNVRDNFASGSNDMVMMTSTRWETTEQCMDCSLEGDDADADLNYECRASPSVAPTLAPTLTPTLGPSSPPSSVPSSSTPTTSGDTFEPTAGPSTAVPSAVPTLNPTPGPSSPPSSVPSSSTPTTSGDTFEPTAGPSTAVPSAVPTPNPTSTLSGCTDPTAINYDATAVDDDGSCSCATSGMQPPCNRTPSSPTPPPGMCEEEPATSFCWGVRQYWGPDPPLSPAP